MIGVIAGDVIGSVYERHATKSAAFPLFDDACRFTDDTVLTIATASAILDDVPYREVYRSLGRRYLNAGYGGNFYEWLHSSAPHPYNSWGNGSAMRVAPVGFAFDTVREVLREAERSAGSTHNHPEGVKGALAMSSTFPARARSPSRSSLSSVAGRVPRGDRRLRAGVPTRPVVAWFRFRPC